MGIQNVKPRRSTAAAPLLAILFAVAALIAATISKMLTTDALYAPVTPDYSAVSAADSFSLVAYAGRSAAVQTLILFIGGLTFFSPAISAIVLSYRGICLGYTAAAIVSESVERCQTSLWGVSGDAIVPILYFVATIPIIIFSASAISFSYAMKNSDGNGDRRGLRYFLLFLMSSGLSVLTSVLISFIK